MITLALDASTYAGTVALLRDDQLIVSHEAAMRGEREERLMPAVANALADAGLEWRDVNRVVCGEGPGSFTSLRIAASIAKGIVFATSADLFAVSSLALIVGAIEARRSGDYLAALDAMRGEAFVALINVDASGCVVSLSEPQRVPRSQLERLADESSRILVGPLVDENQRPHANGVLAIADRLLQCVDVNGWEPRYGRAAEAQVKWEKAHGRPLEAAGP